MPYTNAGSLGVAGNSAEISGGTMSRQRSSPPGPACLSREALVLERLEYVRRAVFLSGRSYMADAIGTQTALDFANVVRGLIPELTPALAAVVAPTAGGAGLGVFPGGVSGGPAAAIGTDIGVLLLDWMGLAFIEGHFRGRIAPVLGELRRGTEAAWQSAGQEGRIDAAARVMAEAMGAFFALLLRGMVINIVKSAADGRFGQTLRLLRDSKLLRGSMGFEGWLRQNFSQLCARYKIKSGIKVVSAGRMSCARFQESLGAARSLLRDMLPGDSPRFRTFDQLHEYMTGRGYQVARRELFGPADRGNPKGFLQDAAQVIYANAMRTVVVKVKTRGYAWGGRPGGTMSVEITDGDMASEMPLCKLDRQGNLMPRTIVGREDVVVLTDGVFGVTPGGPQKMAERGKFEDSRRDMVGSDMRRVSEFEILEGEGVKAVNSEEFARRGHIDFKDFNPGGAWKRLGL